VAVGTKEDALLELLEKHREPDTSMGAQLDPLASWVDVMEVQVLGAAVVSANRTPTPCHGDESRADASLAAGDGLTDAPLAPPAWASPAVQGEL
jgi:hypothetical protein